MRYLVPGLCLLLAGCWPSSFQVSPKSLINYRPNYREVLVRVTAYCAGPCRICGTTGVTTTGKDATLGKGAAADPSWLPAGARIEVPGYGRTMVDDRGGKMRRRYWRNGIPRLDIRFQDHWTAKLWGVRYLIIKVY